MKITKVAIACFRKDLQLLRPCIASIRYWHPDVDVYLIKDLSRGDFSTKELERSFGVKLFPTKEKNFGWGWGKFALVLDKKNERYLFLDSDVVLLGPVLDILGQFDEEFIVTGVKEENKYSPTINAHYIDMKGLETFDPSYQYPGYGFNTGQIVLSSGVLTHSDCADVVEFEPAFKSKQPHLFKHADQGVLNYLLVKASQLNKCRIRYFDFWIWPGLPKADEIDMESIKNKKGIPYVLHWAGMKPLDIRNYKRYDILRFYEDFYYAHVTRGKLKRRWRLAGHLAIVNLKIMKYKIQKKSYQ